MKLKHLLSSETLLSLQSSQDMAINIYVRDSALKWPQIFICTSRQQFGEKGSESLGLSASTVMYHRALRVLTVQLGALLRPRPVSVKDQQIAGQDQELLPQTHSGSQGPSVSLTVTGRVAKGAGPPQKQGLAHEAAQVGPFIPISRTKKLISLQPSQWGEGVTSRAGRGGKK